MIFMINVAVTGASGRMGALIINTILEQDDIQLVAAIEAPHTPLQGKDVGELLGIGPINIPIVGAEKLRETLESKKPDVLIDFTIANAAVETIKQQLNLVLIWLLELQDLVINKWLKIKNQSVIIM